MRWWLVCAAIAVLPLRAHAEPVALRASDGTALNAEWRPSGSPAPAVLLIHMLSRSHTEWDQTGRALQAAGFGVLALDLRGHGRSSGTWEGGLTSMQLDVQAGLAWLKTRPEVQKGRVGIAGASLGATLTVLAAAGDSAVRSIALVSPATDYRGLRCEPAMRRFAERSGAALILAGAGDPYASRSARQLGTITPGLRDVRLIEGSSAHGTALLAASPDLVGALVDWFQRTLL